MSDLVNDAFIASLRRQIEQIAEMGGRVTPRDVTRGIWMFRHGGECLLVSLADRGIGHWEERKPGPRGGRPTKVFVLDRTLDGPFTPPPIVSTEPVGSSGETDGSGSSKSSS